MRQTSLHLLRWLPVLSWRLWHWLKNPSPALVFPQITQPSSGSAYPILGWGLGLILLYYIGLSTVLTQGSSPVIQNPSQWERTLLLLPIVMFGVLISGVAFSIQWTIRMGAALHQTTRTGMFDLIAASPLGGTQAAWLITSAALSTDPIFRQLPDLESPLSRRSTIPVVVILLVLLALPQGRGILSQFILPIILYIALQVDYIQCYILAALVAIRVNRWGRGEIDVRVVVAGVLLAVHGLVFGIWAAYALVLIGPLQLAWSAAYGLPHLIALYLLREFMIILLAQRHTPEFSHGGTFANVN